MKRIIAVIGLALVISALSAASAPACIYSAPFGVWAPNNGEKGNGGQSGNHAPDPTETTCIPNTQGTNRAVGHSPAIDGCVL